MTQSPQQCFTKTVNELLNVLNHSTAARLNETRSFTKTVSELLNVLNHSTARLNETRSFMKTVNELLIVLNHLTVVRLNEARSSGPESL